MAIDYFRLEIVHASDGGSVVVAMGYDRREAGQHPRTGEFYDFRSKAGDLAFSAVLLPAGAPPELEDPRAFAAALEAAEVVLDRTTKLPRFRKNAQLAKRGVLALPRGLQKSEHEEIVVRFVQSMYVNKGIPVHVAVHSTGPDDRNPHAHLTIGTRRLGKTGFESHKARDLNPSFACAKGGKGFIAEQDYLNEQWRAFQTAFFREKGIDLEVDPNWLVPGVHMGAARYVDGSDLVHGAFDAEQRSLDLLDALRRSLSGDQELELDPDGATALALILAELTRRHATFTGRDVMRLLRKHDIRGAAAETLRDMILADSNVLALTEGARLGAFGRYTTRSVRDQEDRALDLSRLIAQGEGSRDRLARLAGARRWVEGQLPLASEQVAALQHVTSGPGLSIVQGIAGAGKSHTVKAVRQCYERAGFRVVGMAPTNAVAQDMLRDGFAEASTVHRALYCQERKRRGTKPFDAKTCVIVDEAAMLDADTYDRLLRLVAETGARLVLVGDDRQLASVQRGGIYEILKAEHGCAVLQDVRRQEEDWMKAATRAFSEGRVAEGLHAYDAHGFVHWSADHASAFDELVARWHDDFLRDPLTNTFVYASTNETVAPLNEVLRDMFWFNRHQTAEHEFESRGGPKKLRVRDRIQFHANDPAARIFNGVVGTVQEIDPHRVVVETDAGDTVAFNPTEFTQWSYGFAGTVYRGQGKTNTRVYALYDHSFAWGARTTYVALTRHRKAVRLFVPKWLAPDLKTLAQQAARFDPSVPSLLFEIAPKAAVEPADATKPVAAAATHPNPNRVLREAQSGPRTAVADVLPPAQRTPLTREDCRNLAPQQFREHWAPHNEALKNTNLDADAKELHRRQKQLLEEVARERGLRPGNGEPMTSLFGRGLYDKDPVQEHPAFEPRKGRIDVQPLMFTPSRTPADALLRIAREIWRFDPAVLNAWVEEIQQRSYELEDNNEDGAARIAAQTAIWLLHSVANGPGRSVASGASAEPCPSLPAADVPLCRIRDIGGLSRGRSATKILSASEMGEEPGELDAALMQRPPEPVAWIVRFMQLSCMNAKDLSTAAETAASGMTQQDDTWQTEAHELWAVGEAVRSHEPDPEDVALAGPAPRPGFRTPRLRATVKACIEFARKVVRWPWHDRSDDAELLAEMPTYTPPKPPTQPASAIARGHKPAAAYPTASRSAPKREEFLWSEDMSKEAKERRRKQLERHSTATLLKMRAASEAAGHEAIRRGKLDVARRFEMVAEIDEVLKHREPGLDRHALGKGHQESQEATERSCRGVRPAEALRPAPEPPSK